HGRRLRIGDKVALAFGSANRDWRKFSEPDVYDLDRRPTGHLGFGAGKHFCLGSQMARLVTEVAMKRFIARVPDYHSPRRYWRGTPRRTSAAPLPCLSRRGELAACLPPRRRELVDAILPGDLIEHRIDHAGLLGIDERIGDIDVFGHDHACG